MLISILEMKQAVEAPIKQGGVMHQKEKHR